MVRLNLWFIRRVSILARYHIENLLYLPAFSFRSSICFHKIKYTVLVTLNLFGKRSSPYLYSEGIDILLSKYVFIKLLIDHLLIKNNETTILDPWQSNWWNRDFFRNNSYKMTTILEYIKFIATTQEFGNFSLEWVFNVKLNPEEKQQIVNVIFLIMERFCWVG